MVENQQRNATQPFTFGGIARFAHARAGRVWFVASLVAAVCGGVMIWFVSHCLTPQITEAISKLPASSEIRDGRLSWPSTDVTRLAEGPWVSITVLPRADQTTSTTSDFDFQLAPGELRLRSLFGYSAIPYPYGWVLMINRDELIPRWGAWKPMVHAGVGIAAALGLLFSWYFLALFYSPLVRLLSYYVDRDITLRGVIKMNMAAMLPAALFMSAGLFLYSLMELSLPGVLLIGAAHFLVQLFYVLCAPFALPKVPEALVLNPFGNKEEKAKARKTNPFKVAPE